VEEYGNLWNILKMCGTFWNFMEEYGRILKGVKECRDS